MAVYVDTSAWIALHEPRDRNHRSAAGHLQALIASNEILVVGVHTLVELADGMVRHYGQKEAAHEIGRLMASPRVKIEPSEPHLAAARDLLGSRPSWGVDLSDCLSFALMTARNLSRAFTYDSDFRKADFRVEG